MPNAQSTTKGPIRTQRKSPAHKTKSWRNKVNSKHKQVNAVNDKQVPTQGHEQCSTDVTHTVWGTAAPTTCNMACKPGDKYTNSTKSDGHKFSRVDTPCAYSRPRWRLLQWILLQWPLLWTASCLSLLLNASKPQSVSGHAMISVSLLSYQPLRAEISTHTHIPTTPTLGGGGGDQKSSPELNPLPAEKANAFPTWSAVLLIELLGEWLGFVA